MKTIFLLCFFPVAALQIASADAPKKAPLVKYTGLWTNSPFTAKPVVEAAGPQANPFDDFTLTGIAPVPGGYRITIMSKKNPDMKKVIEPGGSGEFRVVSVDRNPAKALGTTVVLASGSVQGTVSFEPDLITLKAAPAAAAAPPQQANLPPGANPAIAAPQGAQQNPNGNGETVRQPRPRIVPPPTPAAPASGGAATQGGQKDDRTRRRR